MSLFGGEHVVVLVESLLLMLLTRNQKTNKIIYIYKNENKQIHINIDIIKSNRNWSGGGHVGAIGER